MSCPFKELNRKISRLISTRNLTRVLSKFSISIENNLKRKNKGKILLNDLHNRCNPRTVIGIQRPPCFRRTKIIDVGRLVRTSLFGSGLEQAIWPLVRAWLLEGFALVCEKEVASCSVFKLRELCTLHDNLTPLYMRV